MPVAIKGTGGGSVTLTAGAAAADTTLTLPNTTGTVALTAGPTFTGTVTATTITSPSATALTIQSAGTTAMTVDTSQNVGIGVIPSASTSKLLQISGGGIFGSASDGVSVTSNAVYNSGWKYVAAGYATQYYQTSGQHIWYNAPSGSAGGAITLTQAMTLDASGNLLVGTTSPSGKITINGSYTLNNQNYAYFALSGTTAVTGYAPNQSSAYSLWASNRISAEEFNARSDARMKKEITPIPTTDAMHFINNVQAVHYKWKDSVEDGHKFGFLAQAIVKAGFPNLVGQYPSDNLAAETDADGFTSPEGVMLTVSYDQIIPLLSAAIKELSAKNDALEARLAALEAK